MALNTAKGNTRVPFIPGTRPSIKNAQLLASTGIPSLDQTIGGGLPIGSMFIIEEDIYETYSKVMLKYFMAEGIVTDQPLFVASQDIKPSQLIKDLPQVVAEENPQCSPHVDEQMKIAWRYQNMKIVDLAPSGAQSLGHFYDLTKPMEKKIIEKANITEWHIEDWHERGSVFQNSYYEKLLKRIHELLKAEQYTIFDTPTKRNLLRIAIHSLGSKLWLSDNDEDSQADLIKFLYYLKTFLRNSYAIATITIPSHNFEHLDGVTERIEHISDVTIKLDSFAGSNMETNPLFKDYHGQLYIKKLGALNTLTPDMPNSRDLVFKLRRKKFMIEVLHLPPELGDTTQREQDDIASSGAGCMSGSRKNPLDF